MSRIIVIVFVVAWVACTLWATDAQMRESDQASILTGAVELARGEAGFLGNESYNYDKQYLTYWLVAAVLKATGGGGENATIEGVVRVSNYAAALLFSLGLVTLVLVQRNWPWVKVVVLGCVLLSPVVAFTSVTLSPNLVSGGFVLLLCAVLGRKERENTASDSFRLRGASEILRGPVGKGGPSVPGLAGGELAMVFLLSLFATAARQDVILLMPLLAILVIPFRTFSGVLKNPTLWAMVGGCVLAVVIGLLIDPSPTSLPEPFFVSATFVVYMMGGLGGALLLVLLFAGRMLLLRNRETLVLGLALLVPLLFYACLLYTPRHLFVVALALISTALLPRGAELWLGAASGRVGRGVLGLAAVATLVPWFVGARMTGFTKGRVVVSESTLYPTADGFWPMGAYGDFYGRLAKADEVAVDHNQEVWAAWSGVREEDLPSGKGAIVSSGLASFGKFVLMWHGRERVESMANADFGLIDDRTISKRELGVDRKNYSGSELAARLLGEMGSVEVVGRAQGRTILLLVPEREPVPIDEGVSLRIALSEIAWGNDYRLAPWGEADWKWGDKRGYWIVLAARAAEPFHELVDGDAGLARLLQLDGDREMFSDWKVMVISGEELAELREGYSMEGRGVWIGCGMLPKFMDVGGYGK